MSNNSRKIKEVEELTKRIWSKYRENEKYEKYTKEDAIIRALEILDSNGCWFDPTQEEWEDILFSLWYI